ncbi:MAG: carboxylesterase family protein [bacterium]|nr:carboxylesterase family protein [bacterium]
MKKLTVMALTFALLTGCGGDAEPEQILVAGAAPESTTPPAVATTGSPESDADETTAPEAPTTAMTEDLVYHAGGEIFQASAGKIDVIAPIESGLYPTVIAFHGDPRNASKGWHRSDGRMIAEQGRVVFLPTWGHVDPNALGDTQMAWDLIVRELKCAVAFVKARTADFGGDPDHITLYGLSAGGNATLMAGLAEAEPLDTCAVDGPSVPAQALVPIDADWVLGGSWDAALKEAPEAFYSLTPWRFLDGAQDLPIHVMVTEIVGPYTRSVGPDPADSWLSYRHPDIDLVFDLTERGFLYDGEFGLRESGEYAYQILTEAGYDTSLVLMPGADHVVWGDAGLALVVETVLNAEG